MLGQFLTQGIILIKLPAGEELQEHQVHERAYVVVVDGEVDLAGTTGGAGLAAVFDPPEVGVSGISVSPRSNCTRSTGSPSASAAICVMAV